MSYFGYYPSNQPFSEFDLLESFVKEEPESTEPSAFYLESSSDYRSTYAFGDLKLSSSSSEHTISESSNYPSVNMAQPFNISKYLINLLFTQFIFLVRKNSSEKESIIKKSKKIKKMTETSPRLHCSFDFNDNSIKNYSELEEALNDPKLDHKTKKKIDLMIRNRISAQLSRDRKKAYLTNLKDQNSQLLQENEILSNELKVLRESQQKFPYNNEELHKQHCQPRNLNSVCSKGNINYSLVILAIFMVACFLQNNKQPQHYSYHYESHDMLENSSVKAAEFNK